MSGHLTLPIGDQVPARGNAFTRALGRTAFRLSGWRLEGALPNLPQFVIAVAPHTSNWDFPLGVMTLFSVGFRVSWIGKASLFRWPARGLLRWLGGIPVDRRSAQGLVGGVVEVFQRRNRFLLAIAPEGTRKKVTAWRTGFYRIAEGAGVPIVLAYFDYARRVVGFGPVITPSGDLDADLATILAFYRGVTPKHPDQF